MKKIVRLRAQMIAIILALTLAGTVGLQADDLPAGRYKESCHNCTYNNGTLSCQCCDSRDEGWYCTYCDDDKCRPEDIKMRNRPTSINKLPGITCSSYKNDNGKLGCEKASPDAIKIKQ